MSDTVGTRGARGVRGSPGGHLMILDHLELCWTEVENFRTGRCRLFVVCTEESGGILGPRWGPKSGQEALQESLKFTLRFV